MRVTREDWGRGGRSEVATNQVPTRNLILSKGSCILGAGVQLLNSPSAPGDKCKLCELTRERSLS